MAQAELLKREDLKTEPDYNTEDEELGGTEQECPLNEQEPAQEIKYIYYTDLEDKIIKDITDEVEKEIYLVVESENMSEEEIIINLPDNYGHFKFNDEAIIEDKVLKLKVSQDVEKIKLTVISAKDKMEAEE